MPSRLVDPVTGEILLESGTLVDQDAFRTTTRALGGEDGLRFRKVKVTVESVAVETDEEILERFGEHVTLDAPDTESLTGK